MAPVVRLAQESDLEEADRVLRLAFGTLFGLDDPSTAYGDQDMIMNRWRSGTSSILVAESDSKIVGTAAVTRWGSVGFVGRMAVEPSYQGKKISSLLMKEAVGLLDSWGVSLAGLDTFADSPKHIHLYQNFGFWPRFLNLMISKPIAEYVSTSPLLLSSLSDYDRESVIAACRALTESIYPGLDLTLEIMAVKELSLGDTVLVTEGLDLLGFAVCHAGPGTEAGGDKCFVKFGAASTAEALDRLMANCTSYASNKGLKSLETNVNAGRTRAWEKLLASGFHMNFATVTMSRPAFRGYDNGDVFVVDRWS